MATVQRYVNTASTPGGDGTTNATTGANRAYASLSEWETNAGGSATDDYIVDCCGVAADTTGVTVDFATNITTGSITIRGNRSDPAGFYNGPLTISNQHYRLDVGNVAICLSLNEPNVTVDGIQCIHAHGTSFRAAILLTNAAANSFTTVRNCRVLNAGAVDFGIGVSAVLGGSNHTRTIENNLVVGFDVHQINARTSAHVTHTWNLRHNTVYGDGSAIGIYIQSNTGTGTPTYNVQANAVANCGTDVSTVDMAVGTLNRQDNASEAGGVDITITSAAAAWTFPGTSATGDFTIKDTSSPLYNAVNPTLVTTDITGFTRDGTNHDVGAFEFQAAGGGTTDGAGSVAGSGAGVAVGASTAASAAAASGTSASTGAGASIASAVGSAAGTSVVSAVGAAAGDGSDGVSAGTGAATGVGASTAAAASSASGLAAVIGTGAAIAAAVGAAAGVASAAAAAEVPANEGAASAAGTASAAAVGAAIISAVASAAGSSTVTSAAIATNVGVGASAGTATVTAVGTSAEAASLRLRATVSNAAVYTAVVSDAIAL